MKITNCSGRPRLIPGYGRVEPGGDIDVPAAVANSLTKQAANWAKASDGDAPKSKNKSTKTGDEH